MFDPELTDAQRREVAEGVKLQKIIDAARRAIDLEHLEEGVYYGSCGLSVAVTSRGEYLAAVVNSFSLPSPKPQRVQRYIPINSLGQPLEDCHGQ